MQIKKNLVNLSFILLFATAFAQVSFAQAIFNFDYPFNHSSASPISGVFDIATDGEQAVFIKGLKEPVGADEIVSMDPTTGEIFDRKIIPGRLAIEARIVATNQGRRVVIVSRDNINITIYDLDSKGLLTQRATTSFPQGTQVSRNVHMALSSRTRTGFITISVSGFFRIASISLDTGEILSTFSAPKGQILKVSESLEFIEDENRSIIISGSFHREVVFINAANPNQLEILDSVPIPIAGSSGTSAMSIVFSYDGQYIFAGNGYSKLTAINTDTREIVSSLDSSAYRARRLKILESGKTRYLVMRSLEDGGGAFKGISLIDASNPAMMSVVNQIPYGEGIFAIHDYALTRDGKRLYVANPDKLTGFSIPDLDTVFEVNLPVQTSIKLETYQPNGLPERIFGAWVGESFSPPARLISLPHRFNTRSNFDQDGKSDVGVFRSRNRTFNWLNSSNETPSSRQFGETADIPIAADYDGDNITDTAVYRPSERSWYIFNSSTQTVRTLQMGNGLDEPMAFDTDGDGKADPSVYKDRLNRWRSIRSSDGRLLSQKFARGKGTPVAGDFDGDGKADSAVFYSSGNIYIYNSSSQTVTQIKIGSAGDIPVSGDFDNDGRSDSAVFRPSNGTWYIQKSFAGLSVTQFGNSNDLPAPADYDGDGRTDIAFFRPTENEWHILQSNTNMIKIVEFGQANDIPLISNN